MGEKRRATGKVIARFVIVEEIGEGAVRGRLSAVVAPPGEHQRIPLCRLATNRLGERGLADARAPRRSARGSPCPAIAAARARAASSIRARARRARAAGDRGGADIRASCEVMFDGEAGGCTPRGDAEFAVDGTEMAANGARAEEELRPLPGCRSIPPRLAAGPPPPARKGRRGRLAERLPRGRSMRRGHRHGRGRAWRRGARRWRGPHL